MTVRRTLSALALLGLVILSGCASADTTGASTTPTSSTHPSSAPSPTATATPAPTQPAGPSLELTYIGSDGNVYEMAWPQGTPQQWTTKAQPNKVSYSGLVWSPDGSKLAVLRLTGPTYSPTGFALIVFSSSGQVLNTFMLPAAPYNTPFIWSPDGSEIAYRTSTTQIVPNTNDVEGRLTIIDSQTGTTKETLLYDAGGVGCGGAFPPVNAALLNAHQSYGDPDTFAWTPGQQSILVSRGCGNDSAGLVDLGTQQIALEYPGSASYQPTSDPFILGEWYGPTSVTLGLANANAAEHSTLTSATAQQGYTTELGVATWSPDGQSVYYEHNNGIWTVGADGSNPHQVVAGAPNDNQNIATVQALPSVSPDGSLLLYLQLHGANGNPGVGSVTSQCYVAHTDGSNATALPAGASMAVWRPVQ